MITHPKTHGIYGVNNNQCDVRSASPLDYADEGCHVCIAYIVIIWTRYAHTALTELAITFCRSTFASVDGQKLLPKTYNKHHLTNQVTSFCHLLIYHDANYVTLQKDTLLLHIPTYLRTYRYTLCDFVSWVLDTIFNIHHSWKMYTYSIDGNQFHNYAIVHL